MNSETHISEEELPAGTVTFLFTDIEGSTKLLHQLGEGYVTLLADHHRLMRQVFAKYNGIPVDTEGDAFFVSFPRATEAVSAVVEAQKALAAHRWPGEASLRVRMGLHTGEPWTGGEGYVGMDVHRAARIAHVGYGGQVLLSETTSPLVIDQLPTGVSLLDLGRHRLKDMKRPEHIRQLVIEGLPADFPPLKSLGVVAEPVPPDLERPETPAFLREEAISPVQPVFVGRERELAWLEEQGKDVVADQDAEIAASGRILFVTGEAGTGKSSLLNAFARQAATVNPDLLVTWGQGNAFSGQGDPYLPFREVFAQLAGDVEGTWRAGLLDGEMAGRLWMALPETAAILAEEGDELLENFLSGKALLRNLTAAAPKAIALHNRIRNLIEKDPYSSGGGQSRLFEQVAAVLEGISAKYPLLVILDDLQWVDRGSVDLLFQIGRQLSGKRLLVVVAYRPEDVATGQDGARSDGGRHPLVTLMNELKRLQGDITLDLAAAEGRTFVEEFVDSEPNLLDKSFRDRLFRRTDGHALFTVELLRDMQERGDLVEDEQGRWMESPFLDWDNLPARVEGVIESRIGRLEESLREILTVAAVEGESFTAQVVARVQEVQERKLLRSLSRELALKHHLVSERQALLVGKQMLARYRFAHALFQRYLYNEISPVERRLLHGEIAAILEEIYGEERETIAVQLGYHYQEAGDDEKATIYLLHAGDRARQLNANVEAIDHYRSALSLAEAGRHFEQLARIRMKLGLTYSLSLDFEQASECYRLAFVDSQQAASLIAIRPSSSRFQTLRISYHNPGILDPTMSVAAGNPIVSELFSGLVQNSSEGDILPDVAERWDIQDYGKTYLFHLRDDVRWRDGHPVTAHDFEYAWKRFLDTQTHVGFLKEVRGASAYQSKQIIDWEEVGISAHGEHTLELRLESPSADFMQKLALTSWYPVPQHVVEEQGQGWAQTEKLVSNGPYFLESWPGQGPEAMILVRNPHYHGQAKGNVGRVVMTSIDEYVQDDDIAGFIEFYTSDQIDVVGIGNFSPRMTEGLIRRFADDYVTSPLLLPAVVVLHPGFPPLDDVRVRQAMAMTIDKKAFAREWVGSLHDLGTGGFIPPGMGGYSPGIALPYDPQRAIQLLRGRQILPNQASAELTVLFPLDRKEIWSFISRCWQRHLGLSFSPQLLSWYEYNRQLANGEIPPIYYHGWSPDTHDLGSYLEEGLGGIRSAWNHSKFESLLAEAKDELNQSRRLKLYQQADKILINEAVVVPLYYRRRHLLIKPWIRNLTLSPFTSYRFKNAIVEPH